MASRAYLLSLPERVIRSALGLGAGLLREIGEVAVPRTVRRGQLYKSLVDTTLHYLIEEVGNAKGVYPTEAPQTQDFLARRGVGHAIELLGIAAFRISPVWVFAALADLSGLGRRLIPARPARANSSMRRCSRITATPCRSSGKSAMRPMRNVNCVRTCAPVWINSPAIIVR